MIPLKFRFFDNVSKRYIDDNKYYTYGIDRDGDFFSCYTEEYPSCAYNNSYNGVIIIPSIGMKDMDGDDIYEGDILEVKTQSGRIEKFLVEYGIHRRDMKSGWTVDIAGFAFISTEGFPTFPIVNNYVNGHDLDIIKIIGNKYEHPDLFQFDKKQ